MRLAFARWRHAHSRALPCIRFVQAAQLRALEAKHTSLWDRLLLLGRQAGAPWAATIAPDTGGGGGSGDGDRAAHRKDRGVPGRRAPGEPAWVSSQGSGSAAVQSPWLRQLQMGLRVERAELDALAGERPSSLHQTWTIIHHDGPNQLGFVVNQARGVSLTRPRPQQLRRWSPCGWNWLARSAGGGRRTRSGGGCCKPSDL